MANIKASKKDARTSAIKASANRSVRSAVKTRVTKVRRAVAEGGVENLAELGLEAISALDRAASKGILHRNNAARRKGRLMKRLASAGPDGQGAVTKATPAKKATSTKVKLKAKAGAAKGKAPAAKTAEAKAPAARVTAKNTPAKKATSKKK